MPITLPPLNRRQFLASAVAASVFGRSSFAAEADPNLWAFFSDTHISSERNLKVFGVPLMDHFVTAARELTGLPTRPAGLIVNGDLAFKLGFAEDYAVLLDLMQPIRASGLPIHLALGNHDDRGTFLKSALQKPGAKPIADRHVAVIEGPRARFVIIDSLDAVNKTPGHYGREQLNWLAKTLDESPQSPTIVVGHHDPGGLLDKEAFLKVIDPRRQVKAYVFGHTHSWGIKQRADGLHLVNLPPTAYPFDGKSPSGWVKALIEPNGMKLELRCIDPQHKAHGEKHDLKWRS